MEESDLDAEKGNAEGCKSGFWALQGGTMPAKSEEEGSEYK